MSEPIHILSLGAGVQSSTLALMAAAGEVTPMPVAAVFADTGDEPLGVYLWLSHLKEMLPFPVHVVQSHHGKLSDNLTKGDHSQIPAFFLEHGKPTIGKRQCTNHWKVRPVRKKCRQLSRGGPVVLWQGISTDEVSRCKDSGALWLTHRFPLIEAGLNRHGCVLWLKRRGHPEPPKSACCYCPYRNDAQWRRSKNDPMEWALIKRVDALLNERGEFLHPTCKPIAEVDLSTEEERGQLNMFNNECEGMCGV